MKTYEQAVEPSPSLELSMKWEEPFREFLGQIFYPQYAEELLSDNPKVYQAEYSAFIALYDGP